MNNNKPGCASIVVPIMLSMVVTAAMAPFADYGIVGWTFLDGAWLVFCGALVSSALTAWIFKQGAFEGW